MTVSRTFPGRAKAAQQGWWAANRWLVCRRLMQLALLGLFLVGPLCGWWIVKGTLASSLTLDVLPLTDPLIALQSLLAGHPVLATVWWGALIVTVFYLLVGGRVFCSWVCPVNMVTDCAAWARTRLGWRDGASLPRSVRYGLLGGVLLTSLLTGTIAWVEFPCKVSWGFSLLITFHDFGDCLFIDFNHLLFSCFRLRVNKVFASGQAIREASLPVLRPTVHGSKTSRTQKRSLCGLAASSGVLNPRENKKP